MCGSHIGITIMQKTILILIIAIVLVALVLAIYFLVVSGGSATPGQTGNNTSSQPATKSSEIQGMKVETIKEGSGPEAKEGDSVTVNYVGMLSNGTKFDSSYDRNAPFTFTVGKGRVIKGWDLGVAGMKVGEKRRLTIPPELAYGSSGFLSIPANSTLTFEIEMLKIN